MNVEATMNAGAPKNVEVINLITPAFRPEQ